MTGLQLPWRPGRWRRTPAPRGGRSAPADPFAVLGLAADATLTDDDVRAAWRRVAAATHPDRPDGGDPAAFAAMAAAYTVLRTPFGRTEALADLRAGRPAARRAARQPQQAALTDAARRTGDRRTARSRGTAWRWLAVRRPGRLAVRVLLGTGFCAAVFAIGGWQPAPVALACGAVITVGRGARR
jgi:hypothetical protein